jgi:predicted RNase H-like HicB family nuclease
MAEKKEVYFNYSVLVRKEGNQYASWCPEFDVASSGKNIEQASKNLDEAVNCLLGAYTDLRELKQFFAEKGIALDSESECTHAYFTEVRIGVPATA